MADEIFGDNSLDLLLGDPSRLPELRLTDIKGLNASTSLRHYQQVRISICIYSYFKTVFNTFIKMVRNSYLDYHFYKYNFSSTYRRVFGGCHS